MDTTQRIRISLLALRLSVFVVMLVWTVDKFVNPYHASTVLAYFYGIRDVEPAAVYVLGALELLLLTAFVAGFRKRISYGLVMLFHGATTLSSFPSYLEPLENILFFAAWPMLGACIALYLMRELDTMGTVPRRAG